MLEPFLAALALTPRTWSIQLGRLIRCDVGPHDLGTCPGMAVFGPAFHLLPHGPHGAIVWAADGHPDHDPALRSRILSACGLPTSDPDSNLPT